MKNLFKMKEDNKEKDQGELLSAIPKSSIINNKNITTLKQKEKQESSLFSEIIDNNKEVEKKQSTVENQHAPNPKETVVKEVSLESKELSNTTEPTIEAKVYEITCMAIAPNGQKKEAIIYTYNVPTIVPDTPSLLIIKTPFGRHDFSEIIFGQKKIEVSCREEIEGNEIIADITCGLLIKYIPEEDWMLRGFEETQVLFEKAVLNAYRSVSQTMSPLAFSNSTQGGAKVVKQQIRKINSQEELYSYNDEMIRPGNIPINRGIIWPEAPGEGMQIIPG
jgi:hypothetical protein